MECEQDCVLMRQSSECHDRTSGLPASASWDCAFISLLAFQSKVFSSFTSIEPCTTLALTSKDEAHYGLISIPIEAAPVRGAGSPAFSDLTRIRRVAMQYKVLLSLATFDHFRCRSTAQYPVPSDQWSYCDKKHHRHNVWFHYLYCPLRLYSATLSLESCLS